MKIEIEYCGVWGYEPRARAARELLIKSAPDAGIILNRSGGGVFEITVDGQLLYSKKATGRFPTDAEIMATIGS
jgi:selenoprotein W-related protein